MKVKRGLATVLRMQMQQKTEQRPSRTAGVHADAPAPFSAAGLSRMASDADRQDEVRRAWQEAQYAGR